MACGSLPRTAVNTSENPPLFASIPYEPDGDENLPAPSSRGRMDGVEFFIKKDLSQADPLRDIPELKSVFETSGGKEWRPSRGYNIPLVRNSRVEKWVRAFTGPLRGNFARWITRASIYAPTMEQALREYHVPTDLIYLAMIESGFNPKAYSHAHAAGAWQFIRSTGKLYGLQSGGIIDERRDLIKSSRAAASHLRDLHRIYGDWYLAFAAYNAGPGSVNRAIRRSGTRNYWKMTEGKTRFLRQETKDYVPRILAAAIITKDYRRYGFSSQLFEKPLDYAVVTVPDATDREVIAKCAGTTVEDIQFLNPSLVAGVTPPGKSYCVLVPGGTEERFRKNYARIPKSERVQYTLYQVRRRETLASVASRYKMSKSVLARANRMDAQKRLSVGSYVLIPKKKSSIDQYLVGTEVAANDSAAPEDEDKSLAALDTFQGTPTPSPILEKIQAYDEPASRLNPVRTAYAAVDENPVKAETQTNTKMIIHLVRNGENLWQLSKKYRVTVTMIKKWNGLKGNQLYPHQKIRIYARAPQATAKKVAVITETY